MNILIMGCGRVGAFLAKSLIDSDYNITVIDTNVDNFRRLSGHANVTAFIGDGTVDEDLKQAGIDADTEFKGLPNFSGSHDKTWKLVESQAFQSGVLSEAVWLNAVARGRVDLKKVRILKTTEPYYDYNWSVRPDLDETFGDGFTEKIKAALLSMGQNERQRDILADFGTESFIGTQNENYDRIHDVAKELGMAK